MTPFADRISAGRALAKALAKRNYADPVVLALPRGGVPIGLEVARELNAPLDLIMVRKIGVPWQPELAAAAVVNGEHHDLVVNEEIAAHARLDQAKLEEMAKGKLEEIKRRRALYLKDRAQVEAKGRTAIVVDDGIATGATMRAALKAVRRREPSKLILAVPVAPDDTLRLLRKEVDDVVCLEVPRLFGAIGAHYVDFYQVPDEEVIQLMAEADKIAAPPAPERRDADPGT